jgi:hypothetical protein
VAKSGSKPTYRAQERVASLNRFSGNWKAKLPKTCAQRKKIPTNQANALGISGSNPSAEPQHDSVVGFGRRPCGATTTSEVAEPAKAQRRQALRGDELHCESYAGLGSRKEGRSLEYEIRSVKYRAGLRRRQAENAATVFSKINWKPECWS